LKDFMSGNNLALITQALSEFGKSLPLEILFPTLFPEAAKLVAEDSYAFCIATCLDRQTKADIIWTIPFDIKAALGHLDPQRIYHMSLDELGKLFASLPRRPRFVNDAPKTIQELTRIVVEECDGDAAKIWEGKRAVQVKRTFESIHGVGSGIANMAVLLIEQAFRVHFDDHWNMDIKPDVHTKRVLHRLGMSTAETEVAALEASRRMNPEFPGIVDTGLWQIGRSWCHPSNPDCQNCRVEKLCQKRIR
jgi:endonuclease-3